MKRKKFDRPISDGREVAGERGRFTNMAVPRFDGAWCWQQHLQIVQAILKSNEWSEETVALQLFAHLGGGGRSAECGFADAAKQKGEMGGPIKWAF